MFKEINDSYYKFKLHEEIKYFGEVGIITNRSTFNFITFEENILYTVYFKRLDIYRHLREERIIEVGG